jgi:membrane-bound serine protease (ClpP class)
MSHNWNNRSSRAAFGLCFAVLFASITWCLQAQDAKVASGGSDPSNTVASGGSDPSNTDTPTPSIVEQPANRVLTERYSRAMVIDFDGPIFGARHAYLNNRLDRAQRLGVDLLVIRLTSPGGLLKESVQLARRLAEIDWATTVAFIPEEAISGGAIIALGCDRIYVRPSGLIGDAGPIVLGPDGVFEHVEEKNVSYLHVAMRELAEAKGRPSALARAMADRSLKVFPVKHKESGKLQYLSTDEISKFERADDYEVGASIPEAGENRFLTVDGTRALELQLAEGTFESESELLAALNFDARIDTRLTWVDLTVYWLNRPWLTGLLLFVALIAMYIELAAPGISFAGLTSLACFAVFFWSHALGGTSGWLEVLIFVLGILCLLVELFLLPGFGVFGLSGILLVLLSLIMATQDFLLPNNPAQWEQLQSNSLVVLGSIAVVSILFFGQLLLLDSLPGLNRFQLRTPNVVQGSTATESLLNTPAVEQTLPQVGEQGVAESVLRPSGKVLFDKRLVDVVTEGDYLDPGTPVEVIRREGNRIVVRKV